MTIRLCVGLCMWPAGAFAKVLRNAFYTEHSVPGKSDLTYTVVPDPETLLSRYEAVIQIGHELVDPTG
jgi:hypothetical protein